jgi:hypothetical protein
MRLLHPRTLEICAMRDDIPKTVLSHAWSEVFKYIASGKKHPKMFLNSKTLLFYYLGFVYKFGTDKGCNFDKNKVPKSYKSDFNRGRRDVCDYSCCRFLNGLEIDFAFDDDYLFSDACSLYYKGINIFPDIFGDDWRKYVPVESRVEIIRQLLKVESGQSVKTKEVKQIIKSLCQ